MNIIGVRHDWPEKGEFLISRPNGHKEYTILHFLTSVQFKFEDNIVINARPGVCIVYDPGVPQWFHSQQEVIHNWLHIDSSFSEILNKYNIPRNCLLYPNDTSFISDIFRKIELEHFSNNPYKEELEESYILEFAIKFSRALQVNISSPKLCRQDREKLRSVRRDILSHPEKRWKIADMAALTSLSPSRFHAVYKQLFGTSPIQDVIEAKIGYAKSLLLSNESLTLAAVAEQLGYNDHYHFIRQFKALTGETPGSFRHSRR